MAPIVLIAIDMSYAEGNAMEAQKELDRTIAVELAQVWWRLDLPEPGEIVVSGKQAVDRRAAMQIRRYPLIGRMLPLNLDNGFHFGPTLLQYHGLNVRHAPHEKRKAAVELAAAKPAAYEGRYFTLTLTEIAPVLTLR
jgi:hypothetical protein